MLSFATTQHRYHITTMAEDAATRVNFLAGTPAYIEDSANSKLDDLSETITEWTRNHGAAAAFIDSHNRAWPENISFLGKCWTDDDPSIEDDLCDCAPYQTGVLRDEVLITLRPMWPKQRPVDVPFHYGDDDGDAA